MFSFRKKFLVAAILLYKTQEKSEDLPRTLPPPLKCYRCEIFVTNSRLKGYQLSVGYLFTVRLGYQQALVDNKIILLPSLN